MCLVASSAPPLSPPPPCGDEKEEDSAEEEEADGGGGGAPRDLGSAGTGRGGPGTAPLEPRVAGDSPRRPRSAGLCVRPSCGPGPGPAPRTCPHLSVGSASLPGLRGPAGAEEKGTSPNPPTPGGRRSPPGAHPKERGGDPLGRRDFPGILAFLACISERIKNGRECGGTGAAFSQAA